MSEIHQMSLVTIDRVQLQSCRAGVHLASVSLLFCTCHLTSVVLPWLRHVLEL